MDFGYVRAAAYSPRIKVADCNFNAQKIIETLKEAKKQKVQLAVFPELSLTGYTCGDLFYTDTLLNSAKCALNTIVEFTKGSSMLIFVGVPLRCGSLLYNTAVAINNGKILGVVPKSYLPNYNEFYEKRQFTPADGAIKNIEISGDVYPFGTDIIFKAVGMSDFTVAAEICEDLWVAAPPSVRHAIAGATVIVNLSASNETVGKADYRRSLVGGQSARLVSAYIYADAGEGESTSDLVFSGHNIIAENGVILGESKPFGEGSVTADLDISFLNFERNKHNDYSIKTQASYTVVPFELCPLDKTARVYSKTPFVPAVSAELSNRAELILDMQTHALAKRLLHTSAKCAVIGISGGLDSTLALIAAVNAVKLLGKSPKTVLGITMPCFGTTGRTYNNSKKLCAALNVTFKEINIEKSVLSHFKDIGQNPDNHDVTFENAQARERTQVLMDVANAAGGIVVGTGDLSELALGWATYNGDHMSMYGVNAGIPKTLVRHLVKHVAEKSDSELKTILLDILDTPVSPELIPPDNGQIAQKTEEIVGPYVLHDFFLFYFVRAGFPPEKLLDAATNSFNDEYSADEIKKWLKVFIRRFFSQQFKRNCLPDGVKIGSVALSPRGDWRMPSDASAEIWLNKI